MSYIIKGIVLVNKRTEEQGRYCKNDFLRLYAEQHKKSSSLYHDSYGGVYLVINGKHYTIEKWPTVNEKKTEACKMLEMNDTMAVDVEFVEVYLNDGYHKNVKKLFSAAWYELQNIKDGDLIFESMKAETLKIDNGPGRLRY
jgi:hypothetical protein